MAQGVGMWEEMQLSSLHNYGTKSWQCGKQVGPQSHRPDQSVGNSLVNRALVGPDL